jgi:hypothetical protein
MLLTFWGTAWGGKEQWSTSLRIDQATLPPAATLDSVRTRFNTFYQTASVGISTSAFYFGVKAAIIGPDGRYPAAGNSISSLMSTPQPGAGPGFGYPQLTTVVTLNTALLRGKGSVGRMFLPPTSLPIQADGRLATSVAQLVATASASLITDLNGLLDGDVSVFGGGEGGTGPGSQRDVTSVRVGRVVDTQRRRRNQLSEDYTTATVSGFTGN